MAGGRPNHPTSQKLLKGDARKKGLNLSALKVKIEKPSKPRRIKGAAAKEWHRLAAVLLDNGLITKLDRTALIMYVDAFEQYDMVMTKLSEDPDKDWIDGMLQKTGNTGYQALSGMALVLRDARHTMMQIMTHFGMTPSSREKVSISTDQLKFAWDERPSLN